jgi:single-stranded DNA-binding protein
MNNSFLGGRVDTEVEIHDLANGKTVANFTMSTKHRDKMDFHRIVAWDEAARIAALLRRGDPVFIEGRIQSRNIGEGEQRRREVEIVAWTIYPIKGRVEMEERVSNG